MNVLTSFKVPRVRSRAHMGYVATLPCLACGRKGVEVHHLLCGPELKARGKKASDSWVIPACPPCHRAIHARGDERAFWAALRIDPVARAAAMWARSVEAGRT